ncbi:MAG TPA: hypothetical protein VK612_03720 [Pyrinomonadaceae bacterium]|nr:hypothetical protein [Pyrinomonadaceae bacterium]
MEDNALISDLEISSASEKPQALKAIVYSWLTVGVLDGIAATVNSTVQGGNPIRVFQYVASGVLGPRSYEGGLATYALGVLFHFTVALGASIVFFAASRFLPFLTRMPFVSGPIYGVIVYFVMREVVSPLSLVSKGTPTISGTIIMICIHIVCVGLPIALITSKFANTTRSYE